MDQTDPVHSQAVSGPPARVARPADQPAAVGPRLRYVRARDLRRIALVAVTLLGCGSSGGPAAPPVPDGPVLRVLFVGNSLTYTNDLPDLVAGIAAAAGEERRLVHRTVAFPNVSLSDHWARGDALRAIDEGGWDVVVLQQGPSSLPENRVHLVEWSERFAERIRGAGGRPALLMVWPSAARAGAFDAVRESYAAAARAVDGLFLPAGEGWRAAWSRDPDLALYGVDGFHPSLLGSVVAALVVFEGVYGHAPPGALTEIPRTGAGPVRISPEIAEVAQEAASEAVARFGG